MALTIGSARLGTGLAGAIKGELEDELTKQFGDEFDPVFSEKGLIAMGDAIARAVIEHFEDNAVLNLDGVESGTDNVTVNPPNAIS